MRWDIPVLVFTCNCRIGLFLRVAFIPVSLNAGYLVI